MQFCTVINCMDGRVQLPVIKYLQVRFNSQFVDAITEAGPNIILAEQNEKNIVQSILEKLKISIEIHHSSQVAIVGHYNCAKNPFPKEIQITHIKKAIKFISLQHKNIEVIGLWVNKDWEVTEI